MSEMTKNQTTIEADPDLPVIRIIREFDAPPEKVFRAWTDPELFVRWVGPRSIDTTIEEWDARTGGHYRYSASRAADNFSMGFYGSFHEVRPNERIVQTFSFDGEPDGVSLETLTIEPLDGGRCRTTGVSVVESLEIRDAILSSGMDVGVIEGYEKLDALLASDLSRRGRRRPAGRGLGDDGSATQVARAVGGGRRRGRLVGLPRAEGLRVDPLGLAPVLEVGRQRLRGLERAQRKR
jgi:uncharacterized protein YndB with AHSA1/START domain